MRLSVLWSLAHLAHADPAIPSRIGEGCTTSTGLQLVPGRRGARRPQIVPRSTAPPNDVQHGLSVRRPEGVGAIATKTFLAAVQGVRELVWRDGEQLAGCFDVPGQSAQAVLRTDPNGVSQAVSVTGPGKDCLTPLLATWTFGGVDAVELAVDLQAVRIVGERAPARQWRGHTH